MLAGAAVIAACVECLVPRRAMIYTLELAVLGETGMRAVDGGGDLFVVARRRIRARTTTRNVPAEIGYLTREGFRLRPRPRPETRSGDAES